LEKKECAYAKESRQADGEENPQKLDSLGAEVDDPHCSSARQSACVRQHSATLRWREGGQKLGFGPMLDLSVARGFDRSRAFFSWKQPDKDRKQGRRYCRSRVPSALLVDHQ
jgi:hypothetical protein